MKWYEKAQAWYCEKCGHASSVVIMPLHRLMSLITEEKAEEAES
ncbi:MAG: hypothetical protein QXP20_03550 [Candidatus Bathyarchaeia archaeon]